MKTNNLYPIFLKLDEVQTLIVGGGNIGLEKVNFILNQSPNAKIKVVAREFRSELISIAIKNKNVQLKERAFINDDLIGIKLLILTTNNSTLNIKIKTLAEELNILTNVVDNPPLCDFYTSAVLNKGAVKIAVSSNGISPTLAKRLRDVIADAIPEEVEESAVFLNQVRNNIKGSLNDKVEILNKVTELLVAKNNYKQKLKGLKLPEIILN